jgi:plastocyanin
MRLRARRLALVVVAAAGASSLPQLARGDTPPPTTGSFTAVDFRFEAGGGGSSVTIAQGGTVSFAYPTGRSTHNVDFTSDAKPSACTQTAGADSGPVPPLPHVVTAPGWSGTCTFDAPGTYAFRCDLHASMTGTITVAPPPPTPTPTPPPGPGPSPTPTPTATPTPAPPAPPAPSRAAARGLRVEPKVRGGRVRVSVVVARAGSKLRVDVLGRAGRHRPLRVGRRSAQQVAAGRRTIGVRLARRGRAALKRRHRLAVVVRVRVIPPAGRGVTLRRAATLR